MATMLKAVMGDGREREGPCVADSGARHDGQRLPGRMQLSMKLDFPEAIIGSFHESPNRLTVICSIVGWDPRDPTPDLLGFDQKLRVSQIEHGPVGDRSL